MNRARHARAEEPATGALRHPRSPLACFASAPDRGSSGTASSDDVSAASQPPRSSNSAARTANTTSAACRPIRLIARRVTPPARTGGAARRFGGSQSPCPVAAARKTPRGVSVGSVAVVLCGRGHLLGDRTWLRPASSSARRAVARFPCRPIWGGTGARCTR
jgi:hypothetical protein